VDAQIANGSYNRFFKGKSEPEESWRGAPLHKTPTVVVGLRTVKWPFSSAFDGVKAYAGNPIRITPPDDSVVCIQIPNVGKDHEYVVTDGDPIRLVVLEAPPVY
jgi:hypothetical protein